MATNDPKIVEKRLKWPQCHQSDFRNHLHQKSAPLAVVFSGYMTSRWQFEFRATNWPEMNLKWHQNDPEIAQSDLNRFKVTSKTISIKIPPLLRSFWVVTWLVCDKFEFGDKNGPKLPRNGQKWPKIVRNGQNWLFSLKKTRIDLVYVPVALFDHSRVVGLLSSSREVRMGEKSDFAIVKIFSLKSNPELFSHQNWP